jgi:hypothetical protein
MRRGAAALLAALLFSVPARAEEAAAAPPPRPPETVAGSCPHPEEPLRDWLSIIGYWGTASYGCASARLDWSGEIAFYRDAEATKNSVAFKGGAERNTDFIVTSVVPSRESEVPATGRCRLITADEDFGARRVRCFAKETGRPEFAHLVEMVIAETDWPGTAEIPGRCPAPGIAPYVLGPMIVELTGAQQEPDLIAHPFPACTAMTVVPAQSFSFTTGADRGEVTFRGNPDTERPALLRVKTITLPGGARHPALAGACHPKREADGHVIVLCIAAYADGGATKFVEVGFIPEASRFEWPPASQEPEPLP